MQDLRVAGSSSRLTLGSHLLEEFFKYPAVYLSRTKLFQLAQFCKRLKIHYTVAPTQNVGDLVRLIKKKVFNLGLPSTRDIM